MKVKLIVMVYQIFFITTFILDAIWTNMVIKDERLCNSDSLNKLTAFQYLESFLVSILLAIIYIISQNGG